jgi:hypothetical protein
MLARNVVAALSLLLLVPALASAAPLDRSFTYQGELRQSGTPVDGPIHLRFSLWDAPGAGDPPTGGTQIGANQAVPNVPVASGLFSALVNSGGEFGADAFNGAARWLQIEICTDAGCTSTTVLGPRQALTAAPYALGPWQMGGTNLSYTGGNVGIGTAAPAHSLHIKGTAPAMILEDTASPSNQSGYLAFWNPTSETGWMGYGSIGSPLFSVVNARPSGDIALWTGGERLRVTSAGRVGIGTSTPAVKLEVRGDIRLGSSGEYFAPAGPENLRILRGKISSTGAILFGSGFTASRSSTGVYGISFSPAYPPGEYPILTASAESSGSARFAMVNFPTHIAVAIRIVNGSGTAVDSDFYFIAVGPR